MRGVAAAVDLGSNSFHMIIAGLDHDELVAIERLKEKVQLARGSTDGVLSAAAIQRGLECVARFAQRLRSVPLDRVVVVGTAALRDAQNRDAFLEPAQRMLRQRIRILSGEEEAELIFLGVSQAMAASAGDRLVIDIGGGSTEFCIGGSFAPRRSASINLGCVTLTNRWFGDGASLAKSYVDARRDACALAAPLAAVVAGGCAGRAGDRDVRHDRIGAECADRQRIRCGIDYARRRRRTGTARSSSGAG